MLLSYSSADNFLSPISFSDLLTFCCLNLILNQKKGKVTSFFGEKQQQNAKKVYVKNVIIYSEFAPLTCNMLQTLEALGKNM